MMVEYQVTYTLTVFPNVFKSTRGYYISREKFLLMRTETNNVLVSNLIARGDKCKEKGERLVTLLYEACNKKQITNINHGKINPKRHLN